MSFLATLEELESRPEHVETLTHADGSRTVILFDHGHHTDSPRDDYGTVATLVQRNSRCIGLDDDTAGIGEVRDRYDEDEDLVRRYLAIFRPDILHYVEYWSAGRECYGYGYVTREDWSAAMGTDYAGPITPDEVFRDEVETFRQWADGEVYGAVHIRRGAPIVSADWTGAEELGHEVIEDDCWGFIGYADYADIAAQFTDSPVVES